MSVVGTINPFIMVPQLWQLWTTHETAGISLGTLGIIAFVQAGFTLHGYFIRDRTILLSNVAATTMSLATILSVLLHR
jgi:uncharacterized protein with PQ loop repeat